MEARRLVSVRKISLVLPVLGHPDEKLASIDGFNVLIKSKLKLKPGDLVILFQSNTFLPSTIDEFANLEPQTEWDEKSGFVVPKPTPIQPAQGKAPQLFDGMLMPVSDFAELAHHIRHNMDMYATEEALLNALRSSQVWQIYLQVVEYQPHKTQQPSQSVPTSRESGTSSDSGAAVLFPLPPPQPFVGETSKSSLPSNNKGRYRNRRRASNTSTYRRRSSNNSSINRQDTKFNIIGFRPFFAPKVDMINAQDIKSLFSFKDTKYQITTFMVGTPMTVYYMRNDSGKAAYVKRAKVLRNGRMGVCSRTLDLDEHNDQHPLHWAAAKKMDLARRLDELNRSIVIHGVLCGSSLRDNYEAFPEDQHEFFAYAVVAADDDQGDGNLGRPGKATWELLQQLGLKTVPVHDDNIALGVVAASREDLAALADGPGWFVEKRAGLVLRNIETGRGFKVMSEEYIERYGENSIRNNKQSGTIHLAE